MRAVILDEHARGATILFSTHVMPHAEELCEHVVMIHRGRKVLDDSLAAIRRQFDVRTIRVEPIRASVPMDPVAALPFVSALERGGDEYQVHLAEGTEPTDAIRGITAVVPVARIELARPRLEDIFVRIVSGGSPADEASHQLKAALQGDAEAAAV
jgi:ABC-2 type transport system ATP-binding protein